MSSGTFILLSGTLTFGAPLLLAIHELIALRRRPQDDGWDRRRIDPPPPPPKPLPDCLIPRPITRVRELEDA
jgi:hypothetical protein